MGDEKTVEQIATALLSRGIAARVQHIRQLADRIEREASHYLARAEEGKGYYSTVVAELSQTLTSGVTNLQMATLISTASDADIARAKGK